MKLLEIYFLRCDLDGRKLRICDLRVCDADKIENRRERNRDRRYRMQMT